MKSYQNKCPTRYDEFTVLHVLLMMCSGNKNTNLEIYIFYPGALLTKLEDKT